MRRADIIPPEAFRSMPWRNGLGTTVELLKQDLPGGDGFAWRLSMADVSTDGEFSNFSGYDRTLLLLEGNGITLDCDGARQRLDAPLQASRFRGEAATWATLHDGPVKDFNIMTHRQTCSAGVVSHAQASASTLDVAADVLLIYVVDGELELNAAGVDGLKVPRGHLCVLREPAGGVMRCRAASYIATQIGYRRALAS